VLGGTQGDGAAECGADQGAAPAPVCGLEHGGDVALGQLAPDLAADHRAAVHDDQADETQGYVLRRCVRLIDAQGSAVHAHAGFAVVDDEEEVVGH
jgi:hypothetical protein